MNCSVHGSKDLPQAVLSPRKISIMQRTKAPTIYLRVVSVKLLNQTKIIRFNSFTEPKKGILNRSSLDAGSCRIMEVWEGMTD